MPMSPGVTDEAVLCDHASSSPGDIPLVGEFARKVKSQHADQVSDETKPNDPAAIEINNRLFFRFFQAANTLQAKGSLRLGISNQQWAVLGALSRPQAADGMSVGELSQYLLISRQCLSGVLARLERDGFTQRVTGEADRRSRKVRLTERGTAFWAELAQSVSGFYEQALRGLSFDDRLAFLHFVSLLQRNMAKL